MRYITDPREHRELAQNPLYVDASYLPFVIADPEALGVLFKDAAEHTRIMSMGSQPFTDYVEAIVFPREEGDG